VVDTPSMILNLYLIPIIINEIAKARFACWKSNRGYKMMKEEKTLFRSS